MPESSAREGGAPGKARRREPRPALHPSMRARGAWLMRQRPLGLSGGRSGNAGARAWCMRVCLVQSFGRSQQACVRAGPAHACVPV